jgi:predicted NAD/FAD-binding protein
VERIAVIGSGIAGLAAAHRLSSEPGAARVTLFEAGAHFGGHANTVDVTIGGVTHGVDTGFLVFNRRTYPLFVELLARLGVETAESDMSFSVQARDRDLEWSGSSLAGVFAQRSNLRRPAFWHMLADIVRFNRIGTRIAQDGDTAASALTIGAFLDAHRFGSAFRDAYLLPMVGSIWSCPIEQLLAFPAATLLRFFHNHGLLQLADRPQWLTVRGGARQYVRRIVSGLADARLRTAVHRVQRSESGAIVRTEGGSEHFDQLVFACHTDQALRLLGADASGDEARVLGAIRYQPNRAVLHTDTSLLPARPAAWAAWNHESAAGPAEPGAGSCLHYLVNRLQPLPWQQPVIVSLNPLREPRPHTVIRRFDYEHPVFDLDAIEAQRLLPALQGRRRTWFCGAWTGYGFHEDGLRSGFAVADAIAGAKRVALRGSA